MRILSLTRNSFMALSFLALMAAAPACYVLHSRAAAALAEVTSRRDAAEKTLRQLHDDTNDARALKGEINAEEARRILAPVNRLETAAVIERTSAAHHLGHFAYTLAPEKAVKAESGDVLAMDAITMSADAATDSDVYAFLSQLAKLLPGRLTIREVSIERIGDGNAALSAANVRFKASCEWLSNGTARNMAGG